MRAEELRVLEETRVQAGRVMRLRMKCGEIVPGGGYRSPQITGMSSGRGEACGLDGSRQACEELLCRLEQEERAFRALAREAGQIITRQPMKAEMKAFCRGYFVKRLSVERAAERAGISPRTGWNYKAELYRVKIGGAARET